MDLIFDLDGTLVDSRPGIQHSLWDAVLQVFPHIDPAVLDFDIGPPVREMFQKALGIVRPNELEQLEAAFRASYDGGGWKLTYAYSGVNETLDELTKRGNSSYIVTNKPALATSRILTHLGLSHHFKEILSPDSCQPKFKNKIETLGFLLQSHPIIKENAIYIGDSQEDLYAAERCDIAFLGIEYGYGTLVQRKKQLQVVQSFAELLARI